LVNDAKNKPHLHFFYIMTSFRNTTFIIDYLKKLLKLDAMFDQVTASSRGFV